MQELRDLPRETLRARFRTALYFALQSTRGGVSPELVVDAGRLLESPWPALLQHRSTRLSELHGPTAGGPDWLERQPLVERSQLATSVRAAAKNASRWTYEWRRTSGSTGTPFSFIKDKRMTARMDAVMWAVYGWHGIAPGDRHGKLWGVPAGSLAKFRRRALDLLLSRRRLSAFDMNPFACRAFFLRLRSFKARYLHGYASLVNEFARHCSDAGFYGEDLELKAVICTGEVLSPNVRVFLREFFNCRIVNEYGCTESGTIAFDCEFGTPHLVPVTAWPEVVSSAGRHVAPGDSGEVVVTDLYGEIMPLLRYQLHDRATFEGWKECVCGRELPSLRLDEGRIDSFIETPHRGKVYDAILAYTVPEGVLRFRVRQCDVDLLEAQIMPGPQFDPDRTPEQCKRRWEESLGPGMRVDVAVVDQIPLSESGKLRYFVPSSESGDAMETVEYMRPRSLSQ